MPRSDSCCTSPLGASRERPPAARFDGESGFDAYVASRRQDSDAWPDTRSLLTQQVGFCLPDEIVAERGARLDHLFARRSTVSSQMSAVYATTPSRRQEASAKARHPGEMAHNKPSGTAVRY